MTNPGVFGSALADTNSISSLIEKYSLNDYWRSMSVHPALTEEIKVKQVRPAVDSLASALRNKDYMSGLDSSLCCTASTDQK